MLILNYRDSISGIFSTAPTIFPIEKLFIAIKIVLAHNSSYILEICLLGNLERTHGQNSSFPAPIGYRHLNKTALYIKSLTV